MKHTLVILLSLLVATAVFPQKTRPGAKVPTKKPAVASTVKKTGAVKSASSDNAEFKKASELTDLAEKIAALKNFIATFPESTRKPEAQEMLAVTRVKFADERLQSGDLDTAASVYKSAIDDAASPVSDKLFYESFAKIPAALFWQGKRTEALGIAKGLSTLAEGSAGRLLALAEFYLNIESGADAQALAEKAVELDPASAKAHLTLGIADRLDFRIEDSATAYAKALELDPTSDATRRGLADMKRALGKPDEAAALYREILAKDAANIPAQTGLVLSLFDDGKTTDAESEMAKSLEQNPNNMILLAGAAYWYAAHGNGDKAVELAGKAVETEPRYIWSHIALARGYMAKKQPGEAERVLVKARQYGNFPTLEYELASARRMSGFYREAAEELRKNFSIKDGLIVTNLGGRVPAENKSFIDLLAAERRASIFEPTAADEAENADILKALLEFDQAVNSGASEEDIAKAVDAFTTPSGPTQIHRRLYAASALLEKKVALGKVVDLTSEAVGTTDSGLDVADPGAAVMASELYESRSIAFARGESIIVPDVPRQTLSAILRGRVEELAGWALYYQNQPDEAVVRLKRAVSVLPNPSAWWRSSMWRLGAALQANGKDSEALDAYVKSYKTDKPDAVKYSIVEALYKKVNGSDEGLEAKVGRNPTQPEAPTDTSAEKTETVTVAKPTPTPEIVVTQNKPRIPRNVPMKAESLVPPETATVQPNASPSPENGITPSTGSPAQSETGVIQPTASPQTETSVGNPAASPEPKVTNATGIVAPPQAASSPEIVPEATPDVGIVKQVAPEKIAEPTPGITDSNKQPEKASESVPSSTTDTQPVVEKVPEKVPDMTPQPATEQPKATDTKQDKPTDSTTINPKETPAEKASESVPQPTESPAPATEKPVSLVEKPSESPVVDATKTDQKIIPTSDPVPPPDTKSKIASESVSSPPTEEKKSENPESRSAKSLFEPIIINVPKASPSKKSEKTTATNEAKPDENAVAENKSQSELEKPQSNSGETRARVVEEKPSPESVQKCSINVSRESLSIVNGAGSVGILISLEGSGNLKAITAASSSPKDLEVILEPEIAGAEDKAFYLINSISSKKGIYQVAFELPCGRKEILVTVY